MLPSYAGDSIANLAASIARACGADGSSLAASLSPRHQRLLDQLEQAPAVYLVLLDGVGCRQLHTLCPDGVLAAHQRDELTSVFPSSTAPAITSLMTASTPAAHGVSGWLMHEPGLSVAQAATDVIRALPMDVRGQPSLPVPATIWQWRSWMEELPAQCACWQPVEVYDSDYSRQAMAGAHRQGYAHLDEVIEQIRQSAPAAGAAAEDKRQFTYIYLPQFDATAHRFGWQSDEAAACLAQFDAWFARLLDALAGTGALVLAVADHGFVDIPASGRLQLAQFPQIQACLAAPLAGEPRLVYCRVEPAAQQRFEMLVQAQLGHACELYRSLTLIEAGWFGAAAGQRLGPRCGTHTLVMRSGFTLTDQIPGERAHHFIGMHGGVDVDEMRVPLIVASPPVARATL